MAGGDIQVYPNTATNTDTIVRPTVGGEDIIESIRGTTAPANFSFAVGIPPGDQLQQLSNGGVAVVDPSEPAPADLSVAPDPYAAMSATQITNNLPDPKTQLDEHNRAITSAEQETNHGVDAVIQPPQTVNSSGSTTLSSFAVSGSTITVGVPSDAKAVVLKGHSKSKAPDVAPSWYVTAPKENLRAQVPSFACDFAGWGGGLPGNRLLIMDFNSPAQYSPHDFGTFNGDKLHNGRILRALKAGADAYHGGPHCAGGGDVTFVYVNSNKNSSEVHVSDFKRLGLAQASVVAHLRHYEHKKGYDSKHARAGGDLEHGSVYYDADSTLNEAQGASSDVGGAYVDVGNGTEHGWDKDKLCPVSYAPDRRIPMPQIYRKGQEAPHWGNEREYCKDKPGGEGYKFLGALTLRGYGSQDGGFSPKDAWEALRHASRDQHGAHIGRELADVKALGSD